MTRSLRTSEKRYRTSTYRYNVWQAVCLPLWLVMLSVPASAQSIQPFIACSLPLPPHTMPDSQGKPTGYATDILLAVAHQAGWPVEIKYMPWIRVVDEAQRGKCDLVYTVLKRTDYEAFLVFPREPLQWRPNVFVTLRRRHIHYDGNLEAFMRQHSVGLYRDKAVDDHFETLRRAPWARVDEAIDAHQNLLKLLAGRFDAAIENEQTALYQLKTLGSLQDVEVLQPPLNVMAAYVAFPKAGRLATQADTFDRAIRAIERRKSAEEKEGKTQPKHSVRLSPTQPHVNTRISTELVSITTKVAHHL